MFYTANNIVETPGTEHVAANRRVAQQKKVLAEVGPEVYVAGETLRYIFGGYCTDSKESLRSCSFGDYGKLSLRHAKSTNGLVD